MSKRVIRLTESQLNKVVKGVMNEAYQGIIMPGDTLCEIVCKRKVAAFGSSGDIVKMIQHLLDANGFNVNREGGGMKSGCAKEYPVCDGLFRRHTKDAVMEFQDKYGLTVDGVVGYNTYMAMCANLRFTNSLPKGKFCYSESDCDCKKQSAGDRDLDIGTNPYDIIDKVDCEKLRKCVKKHIIGVTAPDYPGFSRCIGFGGEQKVGQKCSGCPDYFNLMPGPGQKPKLTDFISACISNGCTKKVY